jgi:hypothetical protein
MVGYLGLVRHGRVGMQYSRRDGYGSQNSTSATDGIATDGADTDAVLANLPETYDWISREQIPASVVPRVYSLGWTLRVSFYGGHQ